MGEDREDRQGDPAPMTPLEPSFELLLQLDRRRERRVLISEVVILALIAAVMLGWFRYLA